MLKEHGYAGKATTIWLDIERWHWPADKKANQVFIADLLSAQLPDNFSFGIYSSYYSWEEIVGVDWTYAKDKGLPLWYAHYDDKKTFSDFKAFGGWTAPTIKQYEGDKTSCGIGLDYDFKPKTAPVSDFIQ